MTTGSNWNGGHCAAYFIQCICLVTGDDKDSIGHIFVAEFCEEGDPRATGLINGQMNQAAVPAQLDISSSKLIFSTGWLYNTGRMDK